MIHRPVIGDGDSDLLEIIAHCVRRAASRAAWTAGNRIATRIPMTAITTKTSTSETHFAWKEP